MYKYPYELEGLKYKHSALEPHISKETLKFHYDKHFSTYITNLNKALSEEEELQKLSLEEILKNIDTISSSNITAIRNNGGGVYNHKFYFDGLKTHTKPSEYVKEKISKAFGSMDEFKERFKKEALSVFGSGWAWLVSCNGELKIISTANQETPLRDGYVPILTIDVWEHAYYLDYQNKRAEYIDNYFKVINWDVVEKKMKENNI